MKILERPSRFLIDWTERGLIEADITPASGPGSRRRYSYKAVLRAALGVHLKERYGIPRSIFKNILDQLSEYNFFEDWSTDFVLSTKEHIIDLIEFAKTKEVHQQFLPKYEAELADQESLKRPCSMFIFFYEEGYRWYYEKVTFNDILQYVGFRMEDENKIGHKVTDIVILDLTDLKNKIDRRIKALG